MKSIWGKYNFIKNLIQNNRGQAVLEYVLLTVMIMVVLLSIIIAVARNTQKFAQSYFGGYFECLLELGELPSLGADGGSETECDDIYEPFTFTNGRPPNFDTGGGGNTGNTGNTGDTGGGDDAGNQSDSGANSGGETASSGSSEAGGSSVASSGGMSDGFGGRTQRVPLSGADKSSSTGAGGLAGAPSGMNSFQQDGFGEDGSGRSSYVPVYGSQQNENSENKGMDVVKADVQQEPEQALRGKRVPVSVAKTDDAKLAADEGFSFPDFIKILIIAAIILVIVIFFGGQVMQYNKSQGE